LARRLRLAGVVQQVRHRDVQEFPRPRRAPASAEGGVPDFVPVLQPDLVEPGERTTVFRVVNLERFVIKVSSPSQMVAQSSEKS